MAKKPEKAARQNVKPPIKTGRMQKMVSVPAELYQRLENFPDVNWSSVACQAFEMKLGELAKQKEKKSMSDVVARLKASKLAGDSEEFRNGFAAGEHWAKEHAEASDLERISNRKSREADWDGLFTSFQFDGDRALTGDRIGNAPAVYEAITGSEGDREDIYEFFVDINSASEEQAWNGEYLRGFAEGALSIWDNVKGQL